MILYDRRVVPESMNWMYMKWVMVIFIHFYANWTIIQVSVTCVRESDSIMPRILGHGDTVRN